MLTLYRKEINSFLNSLIGYIVIIVFLLVNGLFLWVFPVEFNIPDYGYANVDGLFIIAPFVFLFLIPAITMRLFAEEKKSGTIELILTRPLTDIQIILGKYFAGLTLVLISLLPTIIYYFSVYQLGFPPGNIDSGGFWGSFIGLLFLGAAFTAIGLFASSITESTIVAFILGVFLCGFIYIGFELIYTFSVFGKIDLFIKNLGINAHYTSMSRGVIDTRDLLYFVSLVTLFVLFTRLSLESRKWERKAEGRRQKAKVNTGRTVMGNQLMMLLIGLVIIVLINIIGSFIFTRFDLTSEKRFSLSKATKELLHELDDVVYFQVYLEGDFPAGFKRLSRETKEILDEFRAYSNKIHYEFIDPSAIGNRSEALSFYDELIRRGLNPTDLQVRTTDGTSQQIIFPGALATYKSRELPLQLLISQTGKTPETILNNSVQALEYNVSNVIRKLIIDIKPKIAFLEGNGELEQIYVYDAAAALQEYYDVEFIQLDEKVSSLNERDTTGDGDIIIRNKYKAIIIAQPKVPFSEKDKFILDQYIMRGGKVLWLIDPVYATMDSLETSEQTIGIAMNLNLDDMLFTYGVRLNPDLILDLNALPIRVVTGVVGDQPQIEFIPWYYFPVITPAQKHPIVNNLNAIMTNFVSSIDLIEVEGVDVTTLLTTSPYSRTVKTPVLISLDILDEEPDERLYSGPPQTVAVLLEGTFTSVFRNRIPPEIEDSPLIGYEDKSQQTQMIVVSDGDVIRNQLHYTQGYPLPLGFDQYTRQSFGNREFILNAMNYLCDDSGLISVRSREMKLRLLDKTKISDRRLAWQLFNTLVPVMIIILYGIIHFAYRKRKYTRI